MSLTTKQGLVFSGACSLLSARFEHGRQGPFGGSLYVNDKDMELAIKTALMIMDKVQASVDVT